MTTCLSIHVRHPHGAPASVNNILTVQLLITGLLDDVVADVNNVPWLRASSPQTAVDIGISYPDLVKKIGWQSSSSFVDADLSGKSDQLGCGKDVRDRDMMESGWWGCNCLRVEGVWLVWVRDVEVSHGRCFNKSGGAAIGLCNGSS